MQSIPKARRTVRITTCILVSLVVGVGAFIGGMRSDDLLAFMQNGQNGDQPESLNLASVQEVYRKLRSQYDGKLDSNALIDGAKKGLVAATGDPYSVYFTNEEAKQFNDDLDGKFSGIGAEIGKKDNNLIVVATLDSSPARKAGLLTNDIIAQVNDEDTEGWSIEQAVSKIRGDKGTTVKLTIVRNDKVQDFSIVRDNIVNPSVIAQVIETNIGYLRISRFAEDTENLVKSAANDFTAKGVKGIILDLRGNGGGYLAAAQSVASMWVTNGKDIVQERTGDFVRETLRANGDAPFKDIPTIVLIDGGSASASEIVAGALNDYKLATLVGTKTFGKGSVQQLVELPLGGQLKVTVAKWYTPNGKNIDKEGISPSTEVTPSDADIAAGKDVQKAKAIELLKK